MTNLARRLFYRLAPLYWRVRQPLTLGARTIVLKEDHILLVRLTYAPGWYLPGGGVDKGESFQRAAARELREECGLDAQNLTLLQVFLSRHQGKNDHVALFLVTDFVPDPKAIADPEIAEMKFFPLNQTEHTPSDLSPGTRRRLEEFKLGKGFSTEW